MTKPTQDPFSAWNELAQKTQEMWLDSAFVFSQRTQRMAEAGINPTEADQVEMSQMGLEKLEAVGEASLAAFQHWGQLQQAVWHSAMQQTQAAVGVMAASVGTPQEQAAAQQAWQYSVLSPEHLAQASADMAHAVLHPVHKRTSENAERLKKVSE
nr:polyhydroxyalkanoate granule-associated phasin [uncultured Deefgea sp.]